jgi:hypothetical protein
VRRIPNLAASREIFLYLRTDRPDMPSSSIDAELDSHVMAVQPFDKSLRLFRAPVGLRGAVDANIVWVPGCRPDKEPPTSLANLVRYVAYNAVEAAQPTCLLELLAPWAVDRGQFAGRLAQERAIPDAAHLEEPSSLRGLVHEPVAHHDAA